MAVGNGSASIIYIPKLKILFQRFCKLHKNKPSFIRHRQKLSSYEQKATYSGLIYFWYEDYADNTFLPFFLLAASTFLPLDVNILFLKPCSLLLCFFLGWNVIFIVIRTSFVAGFHCPIYEHCYYYSKKEKERQEKILHRSLKIMGFLGERKFCHKKILSLEDVVFFYFLILYIVEYCFEKNLYKK